MNKRDVIRNQLKQIYKGNRKVDAMIGRRLSELLKTWISAEKTVEVVKDTQVVKTTPAAEMAVKEAKEIKSESRFREDFPTFSSFYKFVKKEGLTVSDLLDG